MRTETYKEYLLRCQELLGDDSYDPECWEPKEYYFDTEEEMIEFVKQKSKWNFRIEVAFKLNKLSNNIFA